MVNACFILIGWRGRQTQHNWMVKLLTKRFEDLAPMFGEMMALIQNDQTYIGIFEGLNRILGVGV